MCFISTGSKKAHLAAFHIRGLYGSNNTSRVSSMWARTFICIWTVLYQMLLKVVKNAIYGSRKLIPYHSDSNLSVCHPQGSSKRSSMFWVSWKESQNLFMLWKSCSPHHHGLIRFRISDRKFIIQTTEMILWSMILLFSWNKRCHIESRNWFLLTSK